MTDIPDLHWDIFVSPVPGPRLIVTGAVHGIETCGMQAILRVAAEFRDGGRRLSRGRLTLVPVCNPLALSRGTREGEGDLNRAMRLRESPITFEERVANVLCPLLLEHDALLDLHSFQADGPPFAVIGPATPFERADEEAALACRLGVSHVVEGRPIDGARPLLPAGGASTAIFMRSQGRWGVTLECGQHAEPAAPERAYAAIGHALAHLGLVDAPTPPPADVCSVRFDVNVARRAAGDRFARVWRSFDAVRVGELIGTFADGEALTAPHDGYLVFPDPLAKPGTEWVNIARAGTRFAPAKGQHVRV